MRDPGPRSGPGPVSSPARPGRMGSASRGVLALLCAVVLAATVAYLERGKLVVQLEVPLAALEPSEGLERRDTLPIAPGALGGYDVVLVTLDTTRPDRIGCYGNAAIATPNLDQLAAGGVLFSHAYAAATTTQPTHASILTGLYPHRHGVRANAGFALGADRVTLAELLASHGYETAAFVSSFVLNAKFGLNQGFAHYDDRAVVAALRPGFGERRADATTDAALRWLARSREAPYFLWVHYYDAHAPYQAPVRFRRGSANPYDAEIAFVDFELGRLIQAVERKGRPTLWVVAGDHGEALGEHGEQTHGFLVQEATTRIPLIVHATGVGGGVEVTTRVSQVDLLPTLLSALGLPAPADLDGVDLGREAPALRSILSSNADGQTLFGWAYLAALYRGALKFVDGPEPELYDLSQDPLERENLYAGDREIVRELREDLAVLEGAEAGAPSAPRVDLEDEDVRALHALGYLVDAGAPDRLPLRRGGPNPRAMLPLLNRVLVTDSNFLKHDSFSWLERFVMTGYAAVPRTQDELILAFEEIADDHPDFAPVFTRLAVYYEQAHRPEDARRAKRRLEELKRGGAVRDP